MKHDNSINDFHITCFSLLFFFLRGGKKVNMAFFVSLILVCFLPGLFPVLASSEYYYNICMGHVRGQANWGLFFVDLVEGWVRTALLAFFF